MMGRLDSGQDKLFYSFNLDNHVPQSHLLRGIDRFLDLRDLRQHLAPFYSSMGRPSIDPASAMQRLSTDSNTCRNRSLSRKRWALFRALRWRDSRRP